MIAARRPGHEDRHEDVHEDRDEPEQRIARSRSELEYVLTGQPLDPAFPRSRALRMLNRHGPLVFVGVALGLMVVKPRWGAKVLRLLPMVRLVKRMNRR